MMTREINSLQKNSLVWLNLFVTAILFNCGLRAGITYPQLALGQGYECVVILANQTGENWQGTLSLRKNNAQVWNSTLIVNGEDLTGSGEIEVNLPAHGTEYLMLRGDNSLRVGYLEINGSGSSSSSGITVSFFYKFVQNQKLTDSTGTPPGVLGKKFVLPVQRSLMVNTGFAWAPYEWDQAEFDVNLTLFDQNGQVFTTNNVQFNGHRAAFFNELLNQVPESFIGQLQIASDDDIYLTGMRLEVTDTGFQLTGTPPKSLDTPTTEDRNLQVVPESVSMKYSGDNIWIYGKVVNHDIPHVSFVQVLVRAYDAAGQLLGGDDTYISGENRKLSSVFTNTCLRAGGSGYFSTFASLPQEASRLDFTVYGNVQETFDPQGQVEVMNSEVSEGKFNGWLTVTGDVKNTGSVPIEDVALDAFFLNQSGQVIGFELIYPEERDLAVGGMTTFSDDSGTDYLLVEETVFLPDWDDVEASSLGIANRRNRTDLSRDEWIEELKKKEFGNGVVNNRIFGKRISKSLN